MTRPATTIPSQDAIAELIHRAIKLGHGVLPREDGDTRSTPRWRHGEATEDRPRSADEEARDRTSRRHVPCGRLLLTGRDLDLAIGGPGFFLTDDGNVPVPATPNAPTSLASLLPDLPPVSRRSSVLLTRWGRLGFNGDRYLTIHGRRLFPHIQVPEDCLHLTVDPFGDVISEGDKGVRSYIGTLQLATVVVPERMNPVNGVWFEPNEFSGSPVLATPGEHGFGLIAQGGIESSHRPLGVSLEEPTGQAASFNTNTRVFRLASSRAQIERRSTGKIPSEAPAKRPEQPSLAGSQVAGLLEAIRGSDRRQTGIRRRLNSQLQAQLASRRLSAESIAHVLHVARRYQFPRFGPRVGGELAPDQLESGVHAQEISLARRRAQEQWKRHRP